MTKNEAIELAIESLEVRYANMFDAIPLDKLLALHDKYKEARTILEGLKDE